MSQRNSVPEQHITISCIFPSHHAITRRRLFATYPESIYLTMSPAPILQNTYNSFLSSLKIETAQVRPFTLIRFHFFSTPSTYLLLITTLALFVFAYFPEGRLRLFGRPSCALSQSFGALPFVSHPGSLFTVPTLGYLGLFSKKSTLWTC